MRGIGDPLIVCLIYFIIKRLHCVSMISNFISNSPVDLGVFHFHPVKPLSELAIGYSGEI